MAKIILDAGHGGNDLGDAYGYRYEKNDNLRLTMAVGNVLETYGYVVEYIRTNDIYIAMNDRVNIANMSGGDLILSIHRIIGELEISSSGLGFYVDKLGGVAEEAAVNIADELKPLGFENYSIIIRSENILLRETAMPALMMGIGHLNSEYDNMLFDTRREEIAEAIAKGISNTIPLYDEQETNIIGRKQSLTIEDDKATNTIYTVQVGMFSEFSYAKLLHYDLLYRGYPSQIIYRDPYYYVIVGASENLDYITQLELLLRHDGFSTLVFTM